MNLKPKKIGIIAAILIVIIIILTLVVNKIVENKIAAAIHNLPETFTVEYSTMSVHIWSGNLELSSLNMKITGETTNKIILDAQLASVVVEDISYWDYLVNNEITVDNLTLESVIAKYLHNSVVKNKDYEKGFLSGIKQVVNIGSLEINDADVLISDYDTNNVILNTPHLDFKLVELNINPNANTSKEKFDFKDFTLEMTHLKWATNAYENMFVESLSIHKTNATLKGFEYKTKYSKSKYSSILTKERDHFNVTIKTMKIFDMDFGLNKEEQFYFKSKSIKLNTPNAEIYRDKLVADDTSYKLLYGTSLRQLDFDLGIDKIQIENGSISYLEKVKAVENAGRLDFTNLNATISKLGNNYGNADTTIKVTSTFMENSPLVVDWNFKVADTTDQFVFKADLGVLNARQMNQFTQPNLYVDLKGELKQTYFTISGNPNRGRIDLKVKYDDFEIAVLKKNGKEKNKFISTIVNLFVSKDSDDERRNYRYGQSENVERDVTKSVFNFVWLNIKAALLSAMAGDGEKDDE